MKSYSALIIIPLAIFYLFANPAKAQCLNKINIGDLKVDEVRMVASFKLDVNTSSTYKGSIIQMSGTNQYISESFSGNGNKEFSFVKLEFGYDLRYRAVVEFSDENSVLCNKKFIDIDFKSAIR